MKPMEKLIGKKGTPPRCNDIIHWFEGKKDTCMCGKKQRERSAKKKDAQ